LPILMELEVQVKSPGVLEAWGQARDRLPIF
jgi:hypothetical protein